MENPKYADLFLFAGQSNMAGRAIVSEQWPQPAPTCLPGAGYEFRAVSDPTMLYSAQEPFGYYENCPAGVSEPGKKSGSMITAFINEYYTGTKVPIIGVSSSRGGSAISQWLPGTPFLDDTLRRWEKAASYAAENHIALRHKYMAWCQGETDGKLKMSEIYYKNAFSSILRVLMSHGVEHCFLVRIGHFNAAAAQGSPLQDYTEIMHAQDALAAENPSVTMVSTKFVEMRDRGLMRDTYHYFQQAYNEVGTDAGRHTAEYVNGLGNTPAKKEIVK